MHRDVAPDSREPLTFDAIVVGGGPAGEVCAGQLAGAGLETALVERELVGGECSYWACMPSKALLRPGELAEETRRVAGVGEAAVAPAAVLRRRDEVIHQLDDAAQLPWLRDRGVALIRGDARLDGERRLVVALPHGGERRVEARRAVVLATGSVATIPPVPGLREIGPWTNRDVTTAREVPPRLLILGGGVVGVEMAQAWSSLGARVTVVELGERLIAQEEPFASALVADGLGRRGVDVRLGVSATGADREPDAGETVLTLEGGERLHADQLLVAAGRAPRTTGLGLETVGLEPGSHVTVDAQLRVPGRDWLYAIGDVNGRALLTHEGKLHGRLAARVIAGADGGDAGGAPSLSLTDDGPPPRVIFSSPQVAAVGWTLAGAQQAGIDAVAVDGPIDSLAGASFWGRGEPARVRFVVDRARRVLVGATFAGPEVSELVHAASIAVVGAVPVERLAAAAPPFPTLGEAWLALADWA